MHVFLIVLTDLEMKIKPSTQVELSCLIEIVKSHSDILVSKLLI